VNCSKVLSVKKKIIPLAAALIVLLVGVIGFAAFQSKRKPHFVTLTWHEPVPVPGVKVTKYYIYRSTTPNGDYVKIGSSTELKYEDHIVQSGRVYYYRVTAADEHDHESKQSLQATATIP
jgi:fibronectin type 3 domain-containing protein